MLPQWSQEFGTLKSRQTQGRGVPQEGILIRVILQQRNQRSQCGDISNLAQRQRRLEPHPGILVAKASDEGGFRTLDAQITRHLGRLGPHPGLWIGQGQLPSLERCSQLAQSPKCMNAGQGWGVQIVGNFQQRFGGSPADPFELRPQADALVGMAEQAGQGLGRVPFQSVSKQPLHLASLRRSAGLRIIQHPDGSFAVRVPHPIPITDKERSIRAKGQTTGHHACQNRSLIHHFETGPASTRLEGSHLFHGKLNEEEMIPVGLAQGCAGIVDQASWADRIIRQRRCDVSGLVGMGRHPQVLVHPRVVVGLPGDGIPTRVAKLPVQPPARIAALGNVDEALPLLPQVAIVVHGEEVAIVIEGDFLRVAQACGIDLQIRSVGVHSQNTSGVWMPKDSALAIGD